MTGAAHQAAVSVSPADNRAPVYMPAEQLALYFTRLAPGASVIFAHGPKALPPGDLHPTAQMVARWRKAGTARVLYGIDPVNPAQWLHRVYREAAEVSGPPAAQAAKLSGHGRGAAWELTAAGRVYLVLVSAARRGDDCPSNEIIAELAGLRDARAARYQVEALYAAGLCRLIAAAKFGPRVIEICATGKRTGGKP